MLKTKVSTGIFWVEIPEADMRILCGCPADSIKHLAKKGLVTTIEKNGVAFETGPNAILLSELPIQNKRFANLAEFPVLQMLYKQGMILPGHPNNTGVRPMLIGARDQILAQSDYIYRGNYGLISEEEIINTGIDPETARGMMRIKQKFAFDKILKTEELLETKVIGEEETELRNGVSIRRAALNVFEIAFGGEKVVIDLTLAGNEEYEASYTLGFHKAHRNYFSVIHTGEGDGWDINRPCMASIISFQGKYYIIDAGPNIIHSLNSMGISISEIEGIFHTHAHDDHFNGLTALLRSDHRLKYFSAPLVRESVIKKLSALMDIDEELFNKYFDVRDLNLDEWNNIDGLEVMPSYSPHPVETTIMTFRALWVDGYKTYAHLADTSSFSVLEKMVTDNPAKSGITQQYFESVKELYRTPAALKKIDIGGGLIHGSAEDFEGDASERIILSHTSMPLNGRQKEIGSSSSFGVTDILIPSDRDYSKPFIAEYLKAFFPGVPSYELAMLLNCPIEKFNPGTILVSRGESNKNIYLVISGILEFVASGHGIANIMSAGSLAGELSGIAGTPARGTYRAISHIRALKLPCGLFVEFLKRNNYYDDAKNNIGRRRFLQNTWLLGEHISCPVKSKIAMAMEWMEFSAGGELPLAEQASIFMVESGEIEIHAAGKTIETLGAADFTGEESIVSGSTGIFRARAKTAATVWRIPASTLDGIPIAQWKLFETFHRRIRSAKINPFLK